MRLYAIDLSGYDPELIADRCWQAGAAGLWEVDESVLRVGVDEDDAADFLDALADAAPTDVTDEDAVELAGRSSVVAFHGHEIELWVPPTVFGCGHHPTTASCLDLLIEVVTPGDTVLDVGCGSGALSIGAALLGARVTAIDLDPEAVVSTAANAVRNGVAIETSGASLSEISNPGGFDVVSANMTSGSLTPLLPDLVRCTGDGGALVLSGMLDDQWPAIRDRVGGQAETVVVEGWLSAVVRT